MAVASFENIRHNVVMALTQERDREITAFLHSQGLADAPRSLAAGDASFRRYERLRTAEGKTLILMDAPPEHEDVRPYQMVQTCLQAAGYSVPEIYAADEARGFLLLEDLGDASFTHVLGESPGREETLYAAATEALADLYRRGTDVNRNLAPYSLSILQREAALLAEWFLPLVMGDARAKAAGEGFMETMTELLRASDVTPVVFVHRDFHADNLFWLPERSSALRRVGMLDFQDAVLGRPAYDLVSLLEDARRDIAPATVDAALRHYLEATGLDREAFMQEYALYGAQRNAKILGIFARLRLRDQKPRYLSLIPRVWAHFMRDLEHPALAPLAQWVQESFTPEDVAVITRSNLAERAYA